MHSNTAHVLNKPRVRTLPCIQNNNPSNGMTEKNKQEKERTYSASLFLSLSLSSLSLSLSLSSVDKHTTRERTSENLLLHLCCDVFSLSPLSLSLSLTRSLSRPRPAVARGACVRVRLRVCVRAGACESAGKHGAHTAHTGRQQCAKTEGRSDSHTLTLSPSSPPLHSLACSPLSFPLLLRFCL